MASIAFAVFFLAVWLASPTSTFAQSIPEVSPPRVQSPTDVPYPPNAQGDAVVQMELVVEADGTVSSVVVIDGVEPFAEQARAAVLTWRFTAAQQGETPVAARIRARVEFHPAAVPNPQRAAVTKTPAPSEAPLEVTVRGNRHEIGQTTFSASDVREMPGAFGDPFRAIEALPGVIPIVSGLPYFYIRGAPPTNNGFSIDGIRVPALFHLGIGQGVIHPALIEQVDFFPSAPPARYGGVAGAIVAGQTRAPATTPHGEANLRLIDAGGLVESPFGDGRGSILLAGRYGYPGPILGAITPGLSLGYWDYQARATWRVGDRGTLGIFAFGSHDYLATPSPSGDPTARSLEQFLSDFHRVDLRYDHQLDDGHVRFALTAGYDRQGVAPTYVTDRSAAVRLEADQNLSPALRIRGGASTRVDAYGFKENVSGPGEAIPIPSTADPPPTNVTGGAYADIVWRATSRIELVPGVRFDVFESSRAIAPMSTTRMRTTLPAFDPRLSARVSLTPSVAWVSTMGLSHQYSVLRAGQIPAAVVSVPGFTPANRQLQTVAQVSQGFEVALPADIVATTTGFVSRWSGLVDLSNATCFLTGDPPAYQCPADQAVRGYAYGIELLARRPLSKRLSGWLSYTLSRSNRDTHFVSPDGVDTKVMVPNEFDRTHVLNAAIAYDVGRRWRLGLRTVFYSGTPYSELKDGLAVPPYNAYRNPNFFRLDVRIEKRWPLGKSGSLAFVIEGQNVTLSTETTSFGQTCMSDPGSLMRCTQNRVKIGPITLPSVGLEALF